MNNNGANVEYSGLSSGPRSNRDELDTIGSGIYRSTTVPLPIRQRTVLDTAEFSTPYSKKKQIIATTCATIGCLINGTAIGFSGTAIPSMMDEESGKNLYGQSFSIDQQEASWMTAILSLGCFFGGIISGPIMDKLGRRKTLMIFTSLSFLIGYLLIYAAPSIEVIYAGRFISGIGLGFELSVATVYVLEIASSDMRGILGCFVQFMGSFGVLFSFTIGGIATKNWYNLALINAIFVIPFAMGMFFVPESPHWLILRGREYQASESLEWLRGRNDAAIDREIEKIKKHISAKKRVFSASLTQLKGTSWKPFLVSLTMMFFLKFSGFNVFIFYAMSIFQMAGENSPVRPEVAAVLVGLVLVLSCVVSVAVVSKMRRKFMLVASMIGMFVLHALLGLNFYFNESAASSASNYPGGFQKNLTQNATNPDFNGAELTWIPLVAVLGIVFIGNVGYGTLIWVVTAEIIPARSRCVANSVLVGSAYLCGFIVTKTFVDLIEAVRESGTFWIYSGICLLGALFTMVFVPETKGKSYDEIQAFYYRSGRSEIKMSSSQIPKTSDEQKHLETPLNQVS